MSRKTGWLDRLILGSLNKVVNAVSKNPIDLGTPEAIERFYKESGAFWPIVLDAMDQFIASTLSELVAEEPEKAIPLAEEVLILLWAKEGWVPPLVYKGNEFEEGDEGVQEEIEDEDEDEEDEDLEELSEAAWDERLTKYKRLDPFEHKMGLINAIALHAVWKNYPEVFPDGYIPTAEDALMGMTKE